MNTRQLLLNLQLPFLKYRVLKRKHWLANEDNNTFGGVYIFDTKESHDAFVESELYAGVRGNPSFCNFSGKSFENIDSLAKHTRGTE